MTTELIAIRHIESLQSEVESLKSQVLALSSEKVPNGWKLVPIEPTAEMIEAAVDDFFAEARPKHRIIAKRVYKEMLSAV